MKRLLPTLIFLILTAPLCFGMEDFHFSVAPRMGFTCGELNELYYYNDGTLVSQLDWEQKVLFDIGLAAGLDFKNFVVSAAFDYSIPAGTSYMYDSDWEGGEKFSFTKHPIKKSVNLSSELTAGYKIKVVEKISLIPQLQFNYLYNDFEADNGTGTHRGKDVKVYGVDYKRHSFLIFTGLALNVDFNQLFSLSTDFALAPWGYQTFSDYHHGVKRPFTSEGSQYSCFTKYKSGINADFHLSSLITLQCFTRFLFGFPDKGIYYTDFYGSSLKEEPDQKSGSAINSLKTGIDVIFNF